MFLLHTPTQIRRRGYNSMIVLNCQIVLHLKVFRYGKWKFNQNLATLEIFGSFHSAAQFYSTIK